MIVFQLCDAVTLPQLAEIFTGDLRVSLPY